MTIQQRAKETCDAFITEGYLKAIEQSLRDQIEECAKVMDNWAEVNARHGRTYEAAIMKEGARAIRALADGGKHDDEGNSARGLDQTSA